LAYSVLDTLLELVYEEKRELFANRKNLSWSRHETVKIRKAIL